MPTGAGARVARRNRFFTANEPRLRPRCSQGLKNFFLRVKNFFEMQANPVGDGCNCGGLSQCGPARGLLPLGMPGDPNIEEPIVE